MTVKELKDFIENCNDTDYVTFCSCKGDNPVSDYCDISIAYKINISNDTTTQICLMPD